MKVVVKEKKHSKESKEKMSKTRTGKKINKKMTEKQKKLLADARRKAYENNPEKKKQFSKKISESNKKRFKEKQVTIFLEKEDIEKRIKEIDLLYYLEQGWKKGRKLSAKINLSKSQKIRKNK